MWRLVLIFLLLPVLAHAAPEKLAEGVYVLRHADATPDWPEGNTTVVVGKRGLLVVDAGYLPSTARADIAAIRRLSGKPVRYLVNTHWHYDHHQGNAEYVKAFPGVDIVAHRETARLIQANAARYARGVVAEGSPARLALAAAEKRRAEAKDAEVRARLDAEIAARKRELAELGKLQVAMPTLVFADRLDVDLGGRRVEIRHLGRGNTPGDTIVNLPVEGIVVAGDLLVAPVPYAYNSYPRAWIATLEALRGLGAKILVPGHGPVLRDEAYLTSVIDLLRFVVDGVGRLAAAGATLDEVRTRLDLAAFKQRLAGDDPALVELWDDSIVRALLERAFLETRGGVF
jgi:cyclase